MWPCAPGTEALYHALGRKMLWNVYSGGFFTQYTCACAAVLTVLVSTHWGEPAGKSCDMSNATEA